MGQSPPTGDHHYLQDLMDRFSGMGDRIRGIFSRGNFSSNATGGSNSLISLMRNRRSDNSCLFQCCHTYLSECILPIYIFRQNV